MDPARVRSSFDSQLSEAMTFYHTVRNSLNSDADITRLSASTMISVATLWESFVSDLIIAYINRDPSKFAAHLHRALKQDMSDKQKQILNRYAPYSAPRSIDRATIISLIDNDGNNITFSSAQALKKGAKRWVTDANMAGINALNEQQMSVVNLWIALRNHIAHDSERSRGALKRAVSHGALHGTGLHRAQNAIHTPGVYLKAQHRQPNGNPRIEEILQHMKNIAAAI